ncbi:MAG: FAD-dependent monooxygenase [Planctomycetaceae bacterium]|nr:FAD-dependent monooxygenase [Planctomycetaceae bacterium]
MSIAERPLIVGAGPVGLAAALFLQREGHRPRIVETRTEPAPQSKALAVNPRVLDLLESTGVTARMLELGSPVRGMQFHRNGKIVVQIKLAGIHPKYPFMLGLSQATTERLLAQAFLAAGGEIERGVEMTRCQNNAGGVAVDLKHIANDSPESAASPWLLAADGARSIARKQLGVDFNGATFPGEWYLVDAPLKTDLSPEYAHIVFCRDGSFLFIMPVFGDEQFESSDGLLWRVLGSRPNPLAQLEGAEPAGAPVWESSFHVAHRINAEMSVGNVYFAGDAAHIHSPMGARGMNLGVEDAWVFANLVRTGRLSEYDSLRRPVDQRVVHEVEFFSKLIASDAAPFRFARHYVLPIVARTPLQARIKRTVTGLDHPLPAGLDLPESPSLPASTTPQFV